MSLAGLSSRPKGGSVLTRVRRPWARYGIAIAAVTAGLLLRKALTAHVGEDLPTYITFYPAVMVAALLAGLGPGLLATALTVAAVDYWIASPKELFFRGHPAEAAGVVLFSLMGVFLTVLTNLYHRAREKAAAYEKEIALLESKEALQAERDFSSAVLDTTGALVVVLDTEGRIQSFNRACEQVTGYRFEEVKARPFWDFLLAAEEAESVKTVFAQLRAGQFPNHHENDWIAKDGERRRITWSNTCILDRRGEVQFVVATGIDTTERKQAEEKLRESEALYRAIGETIDYGIWVCAPDGRNTYASESFLKLVGMTQEQCSSFGWGAVLHPDDAERTIAAWKDCVRTGGTWDIEHRFRGVDGQYHAVLARGIPVRNERGEIVCWAGINLDISRLKRTEQKLRESQEDLRRAQAVAHVGSWRLNVQRNELLWSEESYRLFGVPRGTPLSYETFLSFVHPEDREHVDRRWKAAVHGEPYDIEHRIIAGGAVKWVRELAVLEVDSQGTLLGGFGTVQDITERKQAEAALAQAHAGLEEKVRKRTERIRESSRRLAAEIRVRRQVERRVKEAEFRYRTVADFTYDWEYWKSPQGTLIYCSPSCDRVTGYTVEEMMADPQLLLRIILPEDRPVWDEHEAAALTRRNVCSIQFRIRHKDGNLRWLDHNCRVVTGQGGEFLGIRASNRDVTERKHVEMEAQRLREEVSRFTRITAAGQLTASIAHELNQPLGAILCNAQAAATQLGQQPISADEVRAALEDILDDCRRAGTVIQRLRSLYEKGTHEFVSLQLNDVIRETLALLRSEFVFNDIKLHLQLDPRLCPVRGNRVELQQVILNLVLNALQALTARDTGARRLSLRTWREKPDTVRAAVSDSGPGLTPEQLSRLFEPFYTTKDRGTGMGLTISHAILEGHLGKLWAGNNPEGGATFHLALPALSEDTT